MFTLNNFYQSKEWVALTHIIRAERINEEGFVICEHCKKAITKAYDCICHHKEALTDDNVNDATVSLNPENISLVHHKCHNIIHNKLGYKERGIYLIYGAPFSGKHEWVSNVKEPGDLILSIDNIWHCVSGFESYMKPPRLNAVVFSVRDKLLECVRYRRGKWNNAYIIGGYPLISDRERLCKELGAKEIYIESSLKECLRRLYTCEDERDIEVWTNYIKDWFEQYSPPPSA